MQTAKELIADNSKLWLRTTAMWEEAFNIRSRLERVRYPVKTHELMIAKAEDLDTKAFIAWYSFTKSAEVAHEMHKHWYDEKCDDKLV